MILIQLLINGLSAGAIYAMIAVGFALIYNATRVLHLAHGGVFTFGGFALYVLAISLGLPLAAAFPLAILLTAAFGVSMELLVYRPLRKRGSSFAAIIIASIGLLALCQGSFALVFGTDTHNLRAGALQIYEVGDLVITQLHLMVAVVAIVVFPALQMFLVFTRFGRAMRSIADNPRLAVIFGIDLDKFHIAIFALGSGLAAVAVGLIAFDIGVRPEMGFSTMFVALIAVIVGGVGYLPGAAAGGLLLGVVQHLSLWQLPARWQDIVLFGALIVFLVFRPQGIFGHMLVSRRA
ncbi:MAG: branched-chain amino acid ABC transporter permease [Alphaproteobacteria bacterium]